MKLRLLIGFIALVAANISHAFSWADLWWNKDQQGQQLMEKHFYPEAQKKFSQPVYKASAAYRAGDYKEAANQYAGLHTGEGYYNLGNALAHQGKYEEAIDAYEQALQINPENADAVYNKKLVEDLLKKDQKEQDQQKQDQQKQDQQKQDQQKQDQQKQDQQKQDQQKQDQQKQDQQKQDQQKQDQQKQDQQKQDQQKQDQQKQDQQKQDQQKQDQQKQDQQKQDQQKQEQQKQDQQKQEQQQDQSLSDKEKKAANEQWLQLVPDDPGGLMRQKFLRDYLKRQRNSSDGNSDFW